MPGVLVVEPVVLGVPHRPVASVRRSAVVEQRPMVRLAGLSEPDRAVYCRVAAVSGVDVASQPLLGLRPALPPIVKSGARPMRQP